jgi:hypothetical protein
MRKIFQFITAIAVVAPIAIWATSEASSQPGYEFEFPADKTTYHLLTEWIIDERLCCPFLEIDLRLSREGGPLWLSLTGRPGTKEFIKEDVPALVQ